MLPVPRAIPRITNNDFTPSQINARIPVPPCRPGPSHPIRHQILRDQPRRRKHFRRRIHPATRQPRIAPIRRVIPNPPSRPAHRHRRRTRHIPASRRVTDPVHHWIQPVRTQLADHIRRPRRQITCQDRVPLRQPVRPVQWHRRLRIPPSRRLRNNARIHHRRQPLHPRRVRRQTQHPAIEQVPLHPPMPPHPVLRHIQQIRVQKHRIIPVLRLLHIRPRITEHPIEWPRPVFPGIEQRMLEIMHEIHKPAPARPVPRPEPVVRRLVPQKGRRRPVQIPAPERQQHIVNQRVRIQQHRRPIPRHPVSTQPLHVIIIRRRQRPPREPSRHRHRIRLPRQLYPRVLIPVRHPSHITLRLLALHHIPIRLVPANVLRAMIRLRPLIKLIQPPVLPIQIQMHVLHMTVRLPHIHMRLPREFLPQKTVRRISPE